jgi:hypothetical protein
MAFWKTPRVLKTIFIYGLFDDTGIRYIGQAEHKKKLSEANKRFHGSL